MSFNRQYLDASPISTSPPASPWRARAEFIRRRPLRFRQIAFLIASLAFVCSLILFTRYRREDPQEWITLEDEYPPPLPFAGLSAHTEPKTPAIHGHPPQVSDTHKDVHTPVQTTPDPVVFSLIMFSHDSATEGAVLMKSIIMYSSIPIEFHIICDEAAQTYLEKRVRLITRPSHGILVRFYLVSWSSMLARLDREGAITSDHSAGTPGLMKLFIHEILPDTVSRAIFIDTDAFFITDPALLWDQFNNLKAATAISMPTHPDQDSEEWHHANRICSCIMLLDLAKLRALRLMDSSIYRNDTSGRFPAALSPPAFEAMYGQPGANGHYEDVKLGDQGYWWAIVSHRPEIFEHLSYEWEISSCLMDMYLTGLGDDGISEEEEAARHVHIEKTPHEGQVILPKMLHFNCLDGTPRFYEWDGWSNPADSLTNRWWPAVQYHVGYKWIWLNAHRTVATLNIETVEDVVFADERFAQVQQ